MRKAMCYTQRVEKPIRFTNHALTSLEKRGATEEEVKAAITERIWTPAKLGRFEARKTFPHNNLWNGKHYKQKDVVPIFIEEQNRIVVITVYVFYSQKEE